MCPRNSSVQLHRIGADLFLATRTGMRADGRAASIRCNEGEAFILKRLCNGESIPDIQECYFKRFGSMPTRHAIKSFRSRMKQEGLLGYQYRSEHSASSAREAHVRARVNFFMELGNVLVGWLLAAWLPVWGVILAALGLFSLCHSSGDYFAHIYAVYGKSEGIVFVGILAAAMIISLFFVNFFREFVVGLRMLDSGVNIRSFKLHWVAGFYPRFVCLPDLSLSLYSRDRMSLILNSNLWGQLLVWGTLMLAWASMKDLSLLGDCLLIASFVASLATIAQLDIFFRLDGYRALCHIIRIDDLRSHSFQALRRMFGLERAIGQSKREAGTGLSILYAMVLFIHHTLLLLGFIALSAFVLFPKLGVEGIIFILLVLFLINRKAITFHLMSVPFFYKLRDFLSRWWIRWPVRIGLVIGIVIIMSLPHQQDAEGRCRIIPVRESGVRAELDDTLFEVFVTEGQWVEKGQLIATLSGRDLQGEVAVLEASLSKESVTLDYWKKEALLREELFKQGGTTERDVATAELKRDEAAQQIGVIEAQLDHRRNQLELTQIKAPISGYIVTPYVGNRTGQVVKKGDLICTIQDTTELIVEIAAGEWAATLIEPGMPIRMRLNSYYEDNVEAEVTIVSQTALPLSMFDVDRIRTDREVMNEQVIGGDKDEYFVRVLGMLQPLDDESAPLPRAGMTGYARIRLDDTTIGKALVRPVVHFFNTEVWSWLP